MGKGEQMKKLFATAASVAVVGLIGAGAAWAGQPTDPGCFGKDRAAGVQALGGSVWGDIASDRAGTNGDLNQAYKTTCGGDPT
jgi:hypothetical protein